MEIRWVKKGTCIPAHSPFLLMRAKNEVRLSLSRTRKHPTPQEYVAVNDSFGESGVPELLLAKYGLSPENIIGAVEEVLKRKGVEA